MRNLASLFLMAALVSWAVPADAQNRSNADPFGGKPPADPFGGKAGGNPFGGDPFGSGKAKRGASASKQEASAPKKLPTVDAEVANARIHAALTDETTQNFIDLPLSDAIRQLSQTHDIPIVIDNRAVEEIGLSGEESVNCSLRKVSLRSFLRLMLREHELTYLIKDEVMQITTLEAAEQNLMVEMYPFPPSLTEKSEQLVKALTSSVVPDAWDILGGPCTVSVVDNVLVVSCTSSMHDDIEQFMVKLERALAAQNARK